MSVDIYRMVRGPAGTTPPRSPGSVRRTATIDMRWPGGQGTQMRLLGRARDLLTPADGSAPRVLAEDVLRAGVAADRTIEDIEAEPARVCLQGLVGTRGGGRLRGMVAETVPAELAAGTPLYLLLDDLAGTTLIAGFAYRPWTTDWMTHRARQPALQRSMEGVCIGFRPGSSGLDTAGLPRDNQGTKPVPPLADPVDPFGWHHLDEITGVSMRRARRLDVRLGMETGPDGRPVTMIEVDSMFQDSATVPGGGRIAVHEYRLEATIDAETGVLRSVAADPRVLPYVECPLAATNVGRLVGTPVTDLRARVLEELKGTAGCTHLNDALRALAEVPVILRPLTAPGF